MQQAQSYQPGGLLWDPSERSSGNWHRGDEGALFLRPSMILGLNSVISGPGKQRA